MKYFKYLAWIPVVGVFFELINTILLFQPYLCDDSRNPRYWFSMAWHCGWIWTLCYLL